MNDLRPMQKILLKKRFIKVLFNKVMEGKFYPYQGILQSIPKFFNIAPLTDQEKKMASISVNELEKDGYIKPYPKIKYAYTLTEKGLKIANKSLEDMRLPRVDLLEVLMPRYDITNRVHNDYKKGDYESAIFKAFKLLEEKVREKANMPYSDRVSNIMMDAFKPDGGFLKYPEAKTNGEQDGLKFLMAGAIRFFKSPRSHRTVITEDPNNVMHVLSFAKLLLDLVDECVLIETISK